MKIIHISIYPPKNSKHANCGGVASYVKNLITNTKYKKDDKIYVLCNKIEQKFDTYKEKNIKVIRCFDKNYKFIFQLLKQIKIIKPDVIHIQQELSLYGNIITAYLLQWFILLLKKYKTITTIHGVVSLKKIDKDFIRRNNSNYPVWLTKIAFNIIYKPICKYSKKIIVHEDYFKFTLYTEYKVKKDKIFVINHGVENFKTIDKKIACQKLNLDYKKNIVLFMGYATGYKGIDLLIKGFSKYAKRDRKSLLIIGAGKHPKLINDKNYINKYNDLKKLAKRLINTNQYLWEGFIEEKNIKNFYCASDVSIYPYTVSMSSSGPMAFAIGYEKPFLASNVFNNIFTQKNILFKLDPTALSNRLEYFFKNKNKYSKYAKQYKNNRLWVKIGKGTYNLYHEKI